MTQTNPAILVLADGTVFRGVAIGASGSRVGEVVFNTSMTGYQEILTDPSYCRQIVTLTCPHIGNVGVNDEDVESRQVFASGLIIRDLSPTVSNWRSTQSLPDYLKANDVVAIAGIDTRKLTRILREKGAQSGCIATGTDEVAALEAARGFAGLAGMDLAQVVTCDQPYEWTEGVWQLGAVHGEVQAPGIKGQENPTASGLTQSSVLSPSRDNLGQSPVVVRGRPLRSRSYHVVAYDFGVKRNILRMLAERGCKITVVPAKTPAADVLAMKPDGVFLSNGPGDPEPCDYAITATQQMLAAGVPLFGICLGHQILGLAVGAKTLKMKFGHRGANHPVQDVDTKRVMITSQNHGFAVDAATLPDNARATHVSLFDGTLQGFELTDKPAFCFQGHPEASPGPHDVDGLFDRFVEMMEKKQ
ncbi:MAG: glutamine-hydrolyzing carbamoyl-phosphate synthase small subunit [Gallionella sp.]|nr:glutamine-hydrolyzing carbamoyl-phosphate synthase small subunit [Gallionella sp.]